MHEGRHRAAVQVARGALRAERRPGQLHLPGHDRHAAHARRGPGLRQAEGRERRRIVHVARDGAAAAAARFYEFAELTEMHHNKKADSPSGTCIKTAELIEEQRSEFNKPLVKEEESIEGSRGGSRPSGLRLHSLRLPGLVAHQQVMFGSNGETYELVHNTIDRSAYMPGVLLVVRKNRTINSLVYGLEKIL